MTVVNPYLSFSGNCEEAFNFYQASFGGEFAALMRWKDMKGGPPLPEGEGDMIMHISLPIGSTVLMGSDTPASQGGATPGTNFTIAITPDSKDDADRLFNGLSEGGKVTMPMADTFWGAYFGMFTDKFEIPWMVNYSYQR